ncbi:type III secretion system export apparatus subunit SctU [Hyalangium sp.]|uniref:type III secretion system export apparatus subunit SctU n=1 Tax=Hyalangium sp. TaxID=2028555 RepID=UPI002D696867|nr:type III secretion system export apparatus subunit SctU [Hyalangium sp.]HYH95814.1 type III secretion system export apparatus subunit SctU [Hyalangium sp.]
MSDEKTEEPTQKKIDDSRKKGQVWKSKDLTGVFVLIVGLGAVKASWEMIETEVAILFRFAFDHMTQPDTLDVATAQLMQMGLRTLILLCAPVLLAGAVIGGLVEFLQVGSLFTMDPLMPKLEKLNPIQGMKNMFSKKTVVEMIKNLAKVSVAGYLVFGVVRDGMGMVVQTVRQDIPGIMMVMGEMTYRVAFKVGLLFLLFSIFDIWWQRKSYMKDMMMSKDEVKREYKQSEGDPHHKAHRKQMHQEIMESAQMETVKSADVIVTNPDHVAVALRYDRDKDAAPRVLAKGLDFKAERIKEMARAADIPLLRNVPLAHALLRVDVGQDIPEDLYDAVAEVLNFVYGLKEGSPARA